MAHLNAPPTRSTLLPSDNDHPLPSSSPCPPVPAGVSPALPESPYQRKRRTQNYILALLPFLLALFALAALLRLPVTVQAAALPPADHGDGTGSPLVVIGTTYVDNDRYAVTSLLATGQITVPRGAGVSLSAGDELLIINMQGADAGRYETAIISQTSASVITLTTPLAHSYNGTADKIMAQRIPHYGQVVVQSGGNLTAHPWDGTTGGVLFFRALTVTVQTGGRISADGLGYRGGGTWGYRNEGYQGESIRGLGVAGGHAYGPMTPNDGGGGVNVNGAGGNYGGQATNAQYYSSSGNPAGSGQAGLVYGNPELRRLHLGSGGGGGNAGSTGGRGGGIIVVDAAQLTVQGNVEADGTNATGGSWGAGGGSGGSIHLLVNSADAGSQRVTAAGGSRYCANGCGGYGGIGRIRIDHQTSLTGATMPAALEVAADDSMDLTLANTWYSNDIRTNLSGTVAAGATQLPVLNGSDFRAGDEVLLITLQGPQVGFYETGILAAAVDTLLTLQSGLTYSYDGVANKVMVQRVFSFDTLTVQNLGLLTAHDWNGTNGGVLFLHGQTVLVESGGRISAASLGYRGGSTWGYRNEGYQGESIYGLGIAGGHAYGPMGPNDGGGGVNVNGAGGNYGGGATNAQYYSSSGNPAGSGQAGVTYGHPELRRLYLGSGGGGGNAGSYGGDGGGILVIDAESLTVQGTIDANGGAGTGGSWGSGGGSGGSVHLQVESADIGNNLVTAQGGSRYCANGCGGYGGIGRVRIDYTTLSGRTAPSALRVSTAGQIDLTLNTIWYMDEIRTVVSGTVTAGATGLPIADSRDFRASDEVLIITLQGPNVGLYETREVNAVAPGLLTLDLGLTNGYDSTTDKIMVQRVPYFDSLIVENGGILTAHDWNGTTGGVIFFRTPNMTVHGGGLVTAEGLGYRGGGTWGNRNEGYQGESIHGLGVVGGHAYGPMTPNEGGGGVNVNGAGGNYGGGATNAQYYSSSGNPAGSGLAGLTYGTSELHRLYLGSGGGGGNAGSYGGDGGGIIWIDVDQLTVTGTIQANGSNGSGGSWGSGGGSGGSLHLLVDTAAVGYELVSAMGGSRFCNNGCGGFGGTGRIRIDYTTALTGTSAPRPLIVGPDGSGDLTLENTLYVDEARTNLTASTQLGDAALTVANSEDFQPGDEVLILAMQGPDTGIYETGVISTVTPGLLTLEIGVVQSYLVPTNTVMVQRVPFYNTIVVQNGGLLTSHDWDGTTGGVVFFRAMTVTVEAGGRIEATGLGYRGGGTWGYRNEGYQGESINGLGIAGGHAYGPMGPNDGGGGVNVNGAGGNYGGGATNAQYYSSSGNPAGSGLAGLTYGTSELRRLYLGSGGGGGNAGSYGGDGGGIIWMDVDQLTVTGTIQANGGGGSGGSWGSGGGSGGSVHLHVDSATIGNEQVAALGGSRFCANGCGGYGGTGRIRIDYTTYLSGTTAPGALVVQADGGSDVDIEDTLYVDETRTALSSSVTANDTVLPVADSVEFAPGDEVLIIVMRGPEAGLYETKIVTAVVPGLLTLSSGLDYTYDTAANKVMVQRVPYYDNIVIENGGLLTAHDWDGTTGGVVFFRAMTVTVQTGGRIAADGLGYRGGGSWGNRSEGYQGESISGMGGLGGYGYGTNQPNVGGGGVHVSGAGGNYAGGATNAQFYSGSPSGTGLAGLTYGTADLQRLYLGSGGGGGNAGSYGGDGGGIVFVDATWLTVDGTIESDALAGSGGSWGSGGGAGGSIYLRASWLDLGTNRVTALGGARYCGSGCGGFGGLGRIRLDYTYLEGSTNPAAGYLQPLHATVWTFPTNLQGWTAVGNATWTGSTSHNADTTGAAQLNLNSGGVVAITQAISTPITTDATLSLWSLASHNTGNALTITVSSATTSTTLFTQSPLATTWLWSGQHSLAAFAGETVTITVSAAASLTGTVLIDDIVLYVGQVDETQSSLQAAPTTVTADGLQTTHITATLRNSFGQPMPNQTVMLAVSGGGNNWLDGQPIGGNQWVIIGTSDLNGVVTATLASTRAGTRIILGRTGSTALLQNPVVTFVAGPATQLQLLMPGETAAPGSAPGQTGTPSTLTAGLPVSLTVRAVDAYWNLVTSNSDTIQLQTSDGTADLPTSITLQNGLALVPATFKTAGSHTVQASNSSNPLITADTSTSFTVVAAPAVRLELNVPANLQLLQAASPVVTAYDPYDNIATGYTGQVEFSSGDPLATVPADYIFTAGDAGVHTFANALRFRTPGTHVLTVTDSLQPALLITATIQVANDVIITENTTWNEPAVLLNSLTVTNSARLTLQGGTVITANTITIAPGATIAADGTGYTSQTGPGAGQYNYDNGAGGASHGGYGGTGNSGATNGAPYGSVYQPTTWGSGGGNRYSEGACGGAGGGAIHLVADTLHIGGTLSANGNGGAGGDRGCGGGAGGSLWLETNNLTGAGAIRANGGNGSGNSRPAGGGSGGRIALYTQNDTFTGSIQAQGGSGSQYGGPGTLYRQTGGIGLGTLFIHNANHNGQPAALIEGSYQFDAITLQQYGHLTVLGTGSVLTLTDNANLVSDGTVRLTGQGIIAAPTNFVLNNVTLLVQGDLVGPETINTTTAGGLHLYAQTPYHNGVYTFTAITIGSGTTLWLTPYNDGDTNYTDDYGVELRLDDLTIDSGGTISADALGYLSQTGPGAGQYNYDSGAGGASYGGKGGNGFSGATSGPIYGSVYQPADLGSGGGNRYSESYCGGYGGGAIHLVIDGTLQVAGTLSAGGGNGAAGDRGCGGGSGGSLWLETDTLSGSGVIRANGGNGSGGSRRGGGGGGGRIALYVGQNTFTGSIQVNGGTGHQAGAVGSLYLNAVDPALSTIEASPITLIADGIGSTTITVTLRNTTNDLLAGKVVELRVTPESGVYLNGQSATGYDIIGTTNLSGTVTAVLTSTVTGVKVVDARTTNGELLTQTATITFTVGPVDTAVSTLVANDTTLIADGVDQATLTATLLDSLGHPIAGKVVTILAPGTNITVTQPVTLTNSQGQVQATIRSTDVQAVTVTAVDQTDVLTLTQTVNLTFVPGPADPLQSTFSITPTSLLADGILTTTISGVLRDSLGHPAANRPVRLIVSGSGNLITPSSELNTDANGNFAFSLASTGVETKTVTIRDLTYGLNLSAGVVEFTAGVVDLNESELTANKLNVAADATDQASLTATLRDSYGHGLPNRTVLIQATGVDLILTQAVTTTDSLGRVQATLRSATMQTVTVTAYDQTGDLTLQQTLILTFTAPPANANNSAVTIYPTIRQANNFETVAITATLRDALNRPLANRPIQLVVTGSNNNITPAVQQTSDANGRVVFYLSSSRAEIKQISLRDVATNVIVPGGTAEFIPIAVQPNRSLVDVIGSPVAAADGLDSILIRVTARDLFDNPVPNATVVLSSTGPVTFIQPFPTNSAGQAFGYVRSTTTGSAVIRAYINGLLIADTASVSFEGPDLAVSKSGPAFVTAGYPIAYNITIANQGFLPATNVVVTDTLPTATFFITQTSPFSYTFDAATRRLVWQVGTLPAGQSLSFSVQATVAPTATIGNYLVNQLVGRLSEPELDTANNQASASTLVKAPVPVLAVTPQFPTLVVESGLTNTLTITVRNDGTGLLQAATVSTPPHISWVSVGQSTLGDLAPGQSVTFTLTADASLAPQDGHYRDRVRILTTNAGAIDIFLDVHVRAPLRDLELLLTNNVSDTVAGANVILTEPIYSVTEGVPGSTTYYRQATTGSDGRLLFAGLESGKAYSFNITAANHAGQGGSVNVVAGSGTQNWSVTLSGLPGLTVAPGNVAFQMLRGELAQQELVIRNSGVADLTDISVEAAGIPFIYMGQPPVGTIIPPGEAITISVNAAPLMTETVDVYNGSITVQAGVQSANVALQAQLTDVEARTLCIEVKTDLGAPLTNAVVKLTDLSGQVVASGGVTETVQSVYVENTANTGYVCYLDLQPGPYLADVGRGEIRFGSKEIEVIPGEGVQEELMIVDEPSVTATWTVIPTTIEDVYTTVLTLTFIPHEAPRLALSPDRINMCDDADGVVNQTITIHNFFPITVTNVTLDLQVSGNVSAVVTKPGGGSTNGSSPLNIGVIAPNEHMPLDLEASLNMAACQGDQGLITINVEGLHEHYTPESWYRLDGSPVQTQPGQQVAIPLKLVNTGFPAASNLNGIPPAIENITLTPPQNLTWMDVSTTTIPIIPVEGEVDFQLLVSPPQWLAEGFYYDYIQVSATNGITALIGIEAEMTDSGLRVETQFVTPIEPGAGGGGGGGGTPPPDDEDPMQDTWEDIVTNWNPDVFGPQDVILGSWNIMVGCYCYSGGGGGGGGWSYYGNTLVHVSGGGSPGPGIAYVPEFKDNVVILQLTQRFSLDREAFSAQLNLANGLASELEDVEVSILFTSGGGASVPVRLPGEPFDPIGDFDPVFPADSLVPTQTLMSGTPDSWRKLYPVNFIAIPEIPTTLPNIPGGYSQFASWTLVPDAPGLTEQAFFQVQALIRYKANGVEKTILTTPQSITVAPQPRIVIDYYIPTYVLGGQTFDWLVVATNVGYGPAINFRVETPQPKIIKQSEKYPTNFTLLGPSVLNWGTVEPGDQVSGTWRILPSNPGTFVDWAAECQHQNYQGVELPPLVYCLPRMHWIDTSYLAESQQWGEDQCSTGAWQQLFGDPVNTFSGNFTYSDLDVTIPTWGPPLEFERSYNSRDTKNGPLGPGWTHNYNVSLHYETFIGTDQDGIVGKQTYFSVRLPHGSYAYFDVSQDGNTLTPFPGTRATLSRDLDTYTLIHECTQEIYTFNAQQKLTSIEDANGNRIEMIYDAFGRLILATDSSGRSLTFTYDGSGHLTTMTDPLGRTAIYSYTLGYLSAVTDFRGQTTRYTYTLPGQFPGMLRSIIDANNNTIVFNQYDNNRRVAWQEDALGNRTFYDYVFDVNTENRITTIEAPDGNTMVETYNTDGQLIHHFDANGNSESYAYDDEYNMIRKTDKNGNPTLYGWEACNCAMDHLVDPMGNTTSMTYDGRNQVTSVRDERGYYTTWTYDSRTNPLTITDANGGTRTFTYGSHGEKLSETDENGHTTTYGYDAYGNTIVMTDALGYVTHMQYDLAGRLLNSTNPLSQTTTFVYDLEDNILSNSNDLGETSSFTYDNVGNLLTMTDALGRVTLYEYNERNNLVRVTNPLGGVQTFDYDGTGNVIGRTDENGHTTQYIYSGLTLTVIDPEGGTVVHTSDPLGNRLSTRDANGRTTQHVYDDNNRLVTTIFPDGSQMAYVYNPADNLLRLTDGAGRTIRYTYDPLGRILSQTDPLSGTILFEYDAVGNQTAITDAAGRTTQYVYDAVNRLVQVIDPLAGVSTFTYDGAGNQISRTDPEGRTTTLIYDDANRLVQVTDPLTGTTTYLYNALGNQVQIVDPLGRTTTIAYDALSRPISSTNPVSGTILYQYDPAGNLLRKVDEDGHPTLYAYDGLNRTIIMTDALGGVTTYAYDGNSNLLQQTDPAGRTTTYTYDVFNQVTSMTNPLNGVTEYEYDRVGNLLRLTNANDETTRYAYDALDRITVVTDTLGQTTTYDYDAVGNLLTLTDPAGNASHYTYDDLDRPLSLTNALSNTTLYDYDAVGNLLSLTDAEGRTTHYSYDGLNRLTALTDALNQTTEYAYDAIGNQVGLLDARGNQTTFAYDGLNRLVAMTNPISGTTVYSYTAAGDLLSASNPLGQVTQYTYDPLHRPVTAIDPLGHVISYTYDAVGNPLTFTDPLGRITTITYDDLNRPLQITDPLGGDTSYTYDALGNQLSLTDAEGRTVEYDYDALNRLLTITDPLDHVTEFAYDPVGNQTTLTDPLGRVTTYDYDATYRLVQVTDPAGGQTLYSYDRVDNPLVLTDAEGRTTTISYDDLNRPTVVTNPLNGTMTFAYDEVGNQIGAIDAAGRVMTYTYDALDRLQTIIDPLHNVTRYDYDALGNLVSLTDPLNRVEHYQYNALNQLAQVTDPLSGTMRFEYDAAGNLVRQLDPLNHETSYTLDALNRVIAVTDALSGTTFYDYDAVSNLLSLTDAEGRTTNMAYDDLNRLSTLTNPMGQSTTFSYDAVGNIVATTDALNNQTTMAYDELDRVTAVTDPLNRTTTYQYDRVGNQIGMRDAQGIDTRYEYDALDRLTLVTEHYVPRGPVNAYTNVANEFSYDAVGNLTALTNPLGNTYTFDYDALNRLSTARDPLNLATTYTYDPVGNLAQMVDPNQNSTTYTYDPLNRATQITRPDETVTFTYDAGGNRLTMSDLTGLTSYSYDALYRLTAVTDPLSQTVQYGYDAIGNRTNLTYPDGATVNYSYDDANRLLTVSDWDSSQTAYQYDDAGRLIQVILPNGITGTLSYDGANQLTLLQYENSSAEIAQYVYSYDQVGNRTQVLETWVGSQKLPEANFNAPLRSGAASFEATFVNESLYADSFIWDFGDGTIVNTTSTLSVTHTYTQAGSFTVTLTAENEDFSHVLTRADYIQVLPADAFVEQNGLLVMEAENAMTILPGGTQRWQQRDRLGGYVGEGYMQALPDRGIVYATNYITRSPSLTFQVHFTTPGVYTVWAYGAAVNPNGDSLHVGLDGEANPTSESIAALTRRRWGWNSRIATGAAATLTIAEAGPHTIHVWMHEDGMQLDRLLFTLDPTYTPTGSGPAESPRASDLSAAFFDPTHSTTESWFIVQADGMAGHTAATQRIDTGRLAATILSDPTILLLGPLSLIAPFASRRRKKRAQLLTAVLLLLVIVGAGWALINGAGFTGTAQAFDLPTAPDRSTLLDPFLDDPAALSSTESIARLALDNRTIDYTYDELYRLTDAVYSNGYTFKYTYDGAGNRLSQLENGQLLNNYLYDQANRLVQVDGQPLTYDDNGNLLDDGTFNYTYDSANRLTHVQAGGSTVDYAYNGDNVRVAQIVDGLRTDYVQDVAQPLPQLLTASQGGTVAKYLRGLGLIGEQSGGTGPNAGPATWQYHLTDALGSVRHLTDATGQATFSQDYDPFGSALETAGAPGTAFGFAGEEQDPITGHLYLRGRTYNPATGRFLQQDTVLGEPNDPRTLHRYTYAFNNPIRYTDPSGRMPVTDGSFAGGGTATRAPVQGGSVAYPLNTSGLARSVNAIIQSGGNSSGANSGFANSVCGFFNGIAEGVENLASEVKSLGENLWEAAGDVWEFAKTRDAAHLIDAGNNLREAAENVGNILENPVVQLALQIAIALSPFDMLYDAACLLTGTDLISGQPLSDFERAAIIVGLVTGIGDDIMQIGSKGARMADEVGTGAKVAGAADTANDARKAGNVAESAGGAKAVANAAESAGNAKVAANAAEAVGDAKSAAKTVGQIDEAGTAARVGGEAGQIDNLVTSTGKVDPPTISHADLNTAPAKQVDNTPTSTHQPNPTKAADDADESLDGASCAFKPGHNSFTAGTLVNTAEGMRPIEEIELGDRVLAEDPETGEQGYYEVTALTDHPTDELYRVVLSDDGGDDGNGGNDGDRSADGDDSDDGDGQNGNPQQNVLWVTPDHPVYVEGMGWLTVENLTLGDRLRRADGGMAKVLAIDQIQLPAPVSVYNFTVADLHTYYVLDTSVLVHNCGTPADPTEPALNFDDLKTKGYTQEEFLQEAYKKIKAERLDAIRKAPGDYLDPGSDTMWLWTGGGQKVVYNNGGVPIAKTRGGDLLDRDIQAAHQAAIDHFKITDTKAFLESTWNNGTRDLWSNISGTLAEYMVSTKGYRTINVAVGPGGLSAKSIFQEVERVRINKYAADHGIDVEFHFYDETGRIPEPSVHP
jgi:RHS repeat-associated protein/uncharacterized repeat protein (TIGR01451 family)